MASSPPENSEEERVVSDILAHLGITNTNTGTNTNTNSLVPSIRLINQTIKEKLKNYPQDYMDGKTLLPMDALLPTHLNVLETINEGLCEEYNARRQVLLKRAKLTTQCFLWSDKGKEAAKELEPIIAAELERIGFVDEMDISEQQQEQQEQQQEREKQQKRQERQDQYHTYFSLYDIFIADQALTEIQKTSAMKDHQLGSLKSLVIGPVPDRGGRVGEMRARGMPKFQPRDSQQHHQQQKGGRFQVGEGGHQGGRGGRGGWKGKRGQQNWDGQKRFRK